MMRSTTFTVLSPTQAQAVAGQIMARAAVGERLTVTVEPLRRQRTDPQRATLWMWHTQVASELNRRGAARWARWDKDAVHELVFLPRFMPYEEAVLPTGEVISAPLRTGRATRAQVSEAMDAYLAWIYEMGMEVTVPDDRWRDECPA